MGTPYTNLPILATTSLVSGPVHSDPLPWVLLPNPGDHPLETLVLQKTADGMKIAPQLLVRDEGVHSLVALPAAHDLFLAA